MSLSLRYLRSTAELRLASAAWDELWQRSSAIPPVHRAEPVAQWVETFHPKAEFHAVVVEQDGQFVAALPLVADTKGKFLSVGRLTGNDWSPAGDLLWDVQSGTASLDLIVRGLQGLPWSVNWLEGIPLAEEHWREFARAVERSQLPFHSHAQARVGVVDCTGDWNELQNQWSSNHRRQVRKAVKKASAEGGVTLRVVREFRSNEEVAEWVQRGFSVEDRSWKGATNSSVLKSPDMLNYFVRQAQCLAQWGQLQLTFLEFAGQPIAFEFGWLAKGVYFTPKVGYDDSFSRFSPGQLLRHELYERFHIEREVRRVDFAGELCDATEKWTTDSYPVGRMVLGNRSLLGRVLLSGFGMYRKYRAATVAGDTVSSAV